MAKKLWGLFVVLAFCFALAIPAAALVTDSLIDLQEALGAAAVGDVVVLEGGTVELAAGDTLVVPAGVTLVVSGGARINIDGGTLRIADGGTFLLLDGGTLCIRTIYAVYIGTDTLASAVMDLTGGNLIREYIGSTTIIVNRGEFKIIDGQLGYPMLNYYGAPFITFANYSEVNAALAQADGVDRELYTAESLAALDDAIGAVEWGIVARYETGLAGEYNNLDAVREQITEWANDILAAINSLEETGVADVVDASASAYVVVPKGSKNDLYITITEQLSNGATRVLETMMFSIDNNASGTYSVGPYKIYVDTKGNDQIRQIYITNLDEALRS